MPGEAALAAELKQALLDIVMVIPYMCGAAHIGTSGCNCEERVHAYLERIAEL